MCWKGTVQLVVGLVVLREEVAWGSSMRLALNPQKSPYLEKCSIRLLISPFAFISLLVCAAAVLLSGRAGAAEEGAGRREHACAREAPTSHGQLRVLLLRVIRLLRGQAGLQPCTWAQEVFLRQDGGRALQTLLSPVQQLSRQSLLRCLKLGVHPKPRPEAKSQRRER